MGFLGSDRLRASANASTGNFGASARHRAAARWLIARRIQRVVLHPAASSRRGVRDFGFGQKSKRKMRLQERHWLDEVAAALVVGRASDAAFRQNSDMFVTGRPIECRSDIRLNGTRRQH